MRADEVGSATREGAMAAGAGTGADAVDLEEIGREFLRDLAERYGSQRSLADALGVSPPLLSRVLSGERGLSNLSEWSERLRSIGVDPREMFGYPPGNGEVMEIARSVAALPGPVRESVRALIAQIGATSGPVLSKQEAELVRLARAAEPGVVAAAVSVLQLSGSMKG